MPSLPTYSHNIKRLRNERGWSQENLASLAIRDDKPISAKTVWSAENAGRAELETLDAIAAAFGITRMGLESEQRKRSTRRA